MTRWITHAPSAQTYELPSQFGETVLERRELGKRIKIGGPDWPWSWWTIVGVVADLKYRGLSENPTSDPDLFQTFNQRTRDFSALVRSALDRALRGSRAG